MPWFILATLPPLPSPSSSSLTAARSEPVDPVLLHHLGVGAVDNVGEEAEVAGPHAPDGGLLGLPHTAAAQSQPMLLRVILGSENKEVPVS